MYGQMLSPSPYTALSIKNSRIASLLYSLPRGSATTGLVRGFWRVRQGQRRLPTLLKAQNKKRSRWAALSACSALPLVLTRSRRSGMEPPSAPMLFVVVVWRVERASGGDGKLKWVATKASATIRRQRDYFHEAGCGWCERCERIQFASTCDPLNNIHPLVLLFSSSPS